MSSQLCRDNLTGIHVFLGRQASEEVPDAIAVCCIAQRRGRNWNPDWPCGPLRTHRMQAMSTAIQAEAALPTQGKLRRFPSQVLRRRADGRQGFNVESAGLCLLLDHQGGSAVPVGGRRPLHGSARAARLAACHLVLHRRRCAAHPRAGRHAGHSELRASREQLLRTLAPPPQACLAVSSLVFI